MSDERLLLSEELYKQTVAFDYVVKRHVKLYSNRFVTYAKLSEPEDHRTIWLDDTAVLQPDRKDAIQMKKRYLRPPGVGSMTALAAVRGKGKQLSLVSGYISHAHHCFWIYKLAGHVHCIGWRPLRTAQPYFQPCFHVKPSCTSHEQQQACQKTPAQTKQQVTNHFNHRSARCIQT